MKSSVAIAISLACAALGFLGGKLSSGSQPAAASPDESRGAVTEQKASSRDDSRKPSSLKSGDRKSGHRPRSTVKAQGPMAEALQEMVDRFNNQEVTLPDGSESELLLFDMAKFGQIMSSIERASEADVEQLRELVRTTEESSEQANVLEALVSLPLLGRDIQLRGGRALDAEIDRALEDPVESEVEEVLPAMIYSLAIQNPTEAEAWLESYSKRTDVDDLIIDTDELRAAIDKAKQAANASK
jgi:hypothetical protein